MHHKETGRTNSIRRIERQIRPMPIDLNKYEIKLLDNSGKSIHYNNNNQRSTQGKRYDYNKN